MVKIAWLILLVSALTDFAITAGGSITSAMLATGSAEIPSKGVILIALVAGIMSAARTIQQALKTNIDPGANASTQLHGTGDGNSKGDGK